MYALGGWGGGRSCLELPSLGRAVPLGARRSLDASSVRRYVWRFTRNRPTRPWSNFSRPHPRNAAHPCGSAYFGDHNGVLHSGFRARVGAHGAKNLPRLDLLQNLSARPDRDWAFPTHPRAQLAPAHTAFCCTRLCIPAQTSASVWALWASTSAQVVLEYPECGVARLPALLLLPLHPKPPLPLHTEFFLHLTTPSATQLCANS